jgi:hypothetical protein
MLFMAVFCIHLVGCKKLSIRGVELAVNALTCDGTATPFAGGDGSAGDPYQICSKAQLLTIGTPPYNTSFFILKSDIDFESTATADTISGFDGNLDGNNYTIKNFTSDAVTPTGGLFDTSSATISDLNLENFSVTSNSYRFGTLVGYFTGTASNITLTDATVYSDDGESEVGGFFGITDGATLTNLTATNISVSTDGHNPHGGDPDLCIQLAGAACAGGITGAASGTTMTSCAVTGSSTVSGIRPGTSTIGGAVGGLVGSAYNSIIVNSHSSANIYGDTLLGGLAGAFQSNPTVTKIEDSYSTGNVNYYYSSLPAYVPIDYDGGGVEKGLAGGLVGHLNSSEILSSYATGDVGPVSAAYMSVTMSSGLPAPEVTEKIGGLIGSAKNGYVVPGGGVIDDCYGTGTVEGFDEVGGLIGKANGATVTNSYVTNASVVIGNDYVGGLIGRFVGDTLATSLIDGCDAGATVTGNNLTGGLVGGLTDVTLINSTTQATTNVTGNDYVGAMAGSITSTMTPASTGITIDSNVAMGTVTGDIYVGGLVGYFFGDPSNYAVFDNNTSSTTVNGNQWTGGNIGFTRYSNITSSSSSGAVTGVGATQSNIGGFVGYTRNVTIDQCSATGDVEGITVVGGFAGNLSSTTASNSFATGDVTQNTVNIRAGGFAGQFSGTTISDSYATGNVSGDGDVGGFVGGTTLANSFTLCYATGAVSGNNNVGGFIGLSPNNFITQSYATGNVTGTGNSLGGLLGTMSVTNITLSYATGNVTGAGTSDQAGGLIGSITGAASTITDIFATGSVSGDTDIGGLIGYINATVSGNLERGYSFAGSLTGNASTFGLVGTNASIGIFNSGLFHSNTLPADPLGDSKTFADVTGANKVTYLDVTLSFTFGAGGWKNQDTALPYFDWMP